MTGEREVLVLRALGLGDFLTGLPAYRGLRRHFASHRMVLAAPRELTGLALLSGAFDEVLPTTGLDDVRWERPAPDVAVNLHGKGPRSHQALLALSPRRRIGFRAPGWSGPLWDADEHDVNRWCRLLETAGVATAPSNMRLRPPAAPPAVFDAIVIHPGASSPSRCWPAARYAEIAGRLASSGCPVVITGSAQERSLAEKVARQAGLSPDTVLAGGLDLLGLASLVAGARLLICGDTGPGHLATAYATPSVLLFGPISPKLWGPPTGQQRHRVLWYGPHRGDPWGSRVDPALLAITPDQVLTAARNQLRMRASKATVPSARVHNGVAAVARAMRLR